VIPVTKQDTYPVEIGDGLYSDVEYVLYNNEDGIPTFCKLLLIILLL
jgi:hypothetical protein